MPSTPSKLPLVFAVVPAFNRCDRTLNFLRSFEKVTYPNKRVVITDDGSRDNTDINIGLNFPDTVVLKGNGHLWWSGGTNMAVRYALEHGADYILTINDDAIMESDFLTHMVNIATKNPKYIVGCRVHREDRPEELWAVGTTLRCTKNEIFSLNFANQRWTDVEGNLPDPYPVHCMPGNGVLLPRAVFDQLGGYDEQYMPQYHADSDLVMRARKIGFIPVISLKSVLYNHILTTPLVTNRHDLIFSKKSDRYWPAVYATLRRHAPFGKRLWLFAAQYLEFFLPPSVVRLFRKPPKPAPPAPAAPPATPQRQEQPNLSPVDHAPPLVDA
jgi:GT2 family glycosyltransferase